MTTGDLDSYGTDLLRAHAAPAHCLVQVNHSTAMKQITTVLHWLLQVTLIYGTVYIVFMFIYYGASSEWVYYVLDWDKPSALGLYVFLPLALFVAFLIWCGRPAASSCERMSCACACTLCA